MGCDDTEGPSTELRPRVAVIPNDEAEQVHAFPWLGYLGHWGEEHSTIYDGPTGPNTNSKWKEPITWSQTSWRDTSFAVPAGHSLGPSATDFFCGAVAAGSQVLTAFVGDSTRVLIMLALDLGVFHRKSHVVKVKEAMVWTVVWIVLSFLFAGGIYLWRGSEPALQFVAGANGASQKAVASVDCSRPGRSPVNSARWPRIGGILPINPGSPRPASSRPIRRGS